LSEICNMSFRGIVDVLGIVLPLLILSLGMIRLFSKNSRGHNTLTMLSAVLLLLVGLIRFFLFPGGSSSSDPDSKLTAIHVSKHSETFNQSLENILNAYYKMTGAFASSDVSSVDQFANNLKNALGNLSLSELKNDTLIYETALQPFESSKTEVATLLTAPSIDAKRVSMKSISDNLFNLFSVVHYDVAKLYWLECEKAFGENNPGNWLSNSEQSVNPYGQKDCAEVRTNINFVPADTATKVK